MKTTNYWRSLLSLLAFLKPYWKQLLLSVTLAVSTILSSVALLGTSALLISRAALQPSIAELQIPIVAVRFFGISRGIFRYLDRNVSHSLTFKLLTHLRVWFYEAIEPLAPARLQEIDNADLMTRAVADIETLENFYTRVVSPVLTALIVTLTLTFFVGTTSWEMALGLLFFLLLAGIVLPLFSYFRGRGPAARQVHLRQGLFQILVESIQGLPDILAYNGAARVREILQGQLEELRTIQIRMSWISGINAALGSLFNGLGLWVVLLVGVHLADTGRLDSIFIASFAMIAFSSFEAVNDLPLAIQYLEGSIVAYQRLTGLFLPGLENDEKPDIQIETSSHPPIALQTLKFEKISFRYGQDQPWALQDLSFSLSAGQSMAVVGPSGAGKTSLTNLLLCFWEQQKGAIRWNGQDIRSYSSEVLRSQISLVSQSTYLFNVTILENLRLANPTASVEEIEFAAKRAAIHDFILSLPEGYQTWVGEHGLRFSAGERQRIAIARALLRPASLIILDEVTSNLDPLNADNIMEEIFSLFEKKALLFITHQVAALDRVDNILVLNQGHLEAQGTHHALLDSPGFYRQMWDIRRNDLSFDR